MSRSPTLHPAAGSDFSCVPHPLLAACFVAEICLLQVAHTRAGQSILLGLCSLGLVIALARRRLRVVLPRPLGATLGGWVAVAGLSCLWSVSPASSLSLFATNVVLPALCFLLAIGLAPSRRYRQAFAVALLVGVAWAGSAAMWALLAGRGDILSSGRAADLHAHYVMRWYAQPGLGSTLPLLALPMIYWFFVERLLPAGVLGAAAVWSMLAGAATYNRMFWPTLLCAAIAIFALHGSARFRLLPNWRGAAYLIAAVCATVLLVLAATAVRIAGTIDGPSLSAAAVMLFEDARVDIWQTWIAAGAGHPVLGSGFGKEAARELYAAQLDAATAQGVSRFVGAHPHNLLLSTWVQTGLIGLTAFLALMWAVARNALDTFRRGGLFAHLGAALMALLVVLLVKNFTDDFYDRTMPVAFWSYAGMLVGRARDLAQRVHNPL